MSGATGVSATLTLINDDADSDTIIAAFQGSVSLTGAETVATTQTVTSAQPRTPTSNLANEITVAGFNFSPYLNHFVRVQGTQSYAVITKIVGTGVIRLGELWDTSSNTQASTSGIGTGAVIEVVNTRKGPLKLIVTGDASFVISDIAFDGSGPASIYQSSGFAPECIRTIMGGASSRFEALTPANDSLWIGGLFKGGACTVTTTLLTQGTAFTCASLNLEGFSGAPPFKFRSPVFQATQIDLEAAHLQINGDFGHFDVPAAGSGVTLSRFNLGSILNFTSGSEYGGGNDATANIWTVGPSSVVQYVSTSPPTMDAGLGVSINGGNVSLASLPIAISPFTGSGVVDQTAVAGCLQTDASGNTTSTGTPCGSGSGGVSLASGTAQRISVAPTTGAVVVDTIGGYYSGALSSGNEDLGTTLTNGLVCDTTTAGVAVLRTCASGTDYQPPTAKTCSAGQFVDEIDTTGAVTCAAPGVAAFYQTWTDGTLTPLPQETFSTAGAGLSIADDPSDNATVVSLPAVGSAGSCTNCSLTFDLFGRETARASGTAPVTSVTGTSGQILCTPTSPNPICSLIATGVTGTTCTNCSLGYDTLGRLTSASSGTAPVTSIGVTAPITTTGGTTPTIGISLPSADVAFGTGTNVTGTGFFQWNGFNPGLTSLEELQIYNSNSSAAGLAGIRIGTSSAFTQGFSFSMIAPGWSSGGGLSVGDVLAEENAGSTAAVHFSNFGATGTIDFDTGGSRTKRLIIDSSGNVDVPQLSAGGVVKALTSQPGQLAIAAAGTDYQAPMSAADATVVFPTANTVRRAAITGDCAVGAASNACTIADLGKVWTDASDAANNAPDYLAAKIISSSTVAVIPVGSHDQQLQLSVPVGTGSQTMFWSWNMNGALSNSNEFVCEGGSNIGTETCNQYPLLQSFGHVTWYINIVNNSDTGTPSWTVTFWKNGSATAVTGTFTVGTSIGVINMGTSTLSLAPGDVVGLVYNGTGFVAGQSTAMVTARFDP